MKNNIINFNSKNNDKEQKYKKLASFLFDNNISPMDIEEFIFDNEANMIMNFYEEIGIQNPEEEVYKLLELIADYSTKIVTSLVESAEEIASEYNIPISTVIALSSNMIVSNLAKEELEVGLAVEEELQSKNSDDLDLS